MADKIEKALKRFSNRERRWVKEILEALDSTELRGLDIVKLKGRDDIYRVRKGDVRVIFRRYDHKIFALSIERRSEKTYRRS